MFSGFQSNAFQNNAFQIGRQSIPSPIEHGGGFHEEYYKKHRKYLESLTRATSLEKIDPEAIEAAQEVLEFPIETPEIAKIAQDLEVTGTLKLRSINFDALQREIDLINAHLDMTNLYRIKIIEMELEADDELALMLMM